MKIFILISLTILASGCATAPGKMAESDYIWSNHKSQNNYQEIYRRFETGLRTCGIPYDSSLYSDNESAVIFTYLPDFMGQKSAWVSGKIEIETTPKKTSTIKIGVQSKYDDPILGPRGKLRNMWKSFITGDYSVCN